jgi:hypothetical protein
MDDHTSPAAGAVMRRSRFDGYARETGFERIEALPIQDDFLRFDGLDR